MNAEAALAKQIDQYRRMTGEQRLGIALDLHELSCAETCQGIRALVERRNQTQTNVKRTNRYEMIVWRNTEDEAYAGRSGASRLHGSRSPAPAICLAVG
jgi:hypothetical protein